MKIPSSLIHPVAIAMALMAAACSDDTPDLPADARLPDAAPDASPPDAAPDAREPVLRDIGLRTNALDLLFVIDNSQSMDAAQSALIRQFPAFIEALENTYGGLPDLHVGIISTDVNGHTGSIAGCNPLDDNGRLQSVPRGDCQGPDGAFIRDSIGPDSSRDRNYTGSLADTFACIAPLGVTGCGFEQPLEAMRRAFDSTINPANEGFLRPHAMLGVVILSNEDDCSASDTRLFNPDIIELGPLSSFRCFEQGVICDPDEPRAVGAKSNCRPREDSFFMHQVESYVLFLRALKSDPSRIFVATIDGDPSPVEVSMSSTTEQLELGPSCQFTDASGASATPAVRLDAFAGAFSQRNAQISICSDDYSPALSSLSEAVAESYQDICLMGDIFDIDSSTPDTQVTCEVRYRNADGTEATLPVCDNANDPERSANLPCFQVNAEPDECGDTESQLALDVYGVPVPARDALDPLHVQCLSL